MNEKDRAAIAEGLSRLLADSYTLYLIMFDTVGSKKQFTVASAAFFQWTRA
jgi:hypothetical protein